MNLTIDDALTTLNVLDEIINDFLLLISSIEDHWLSEYYLHVVDRRDATKTIEILS